MIRTLIRKELIEHGWVFALLLGATLCGFLLVLAGASVNEAGSTLEAVRLYAITLYWLTALVVCNRLVVQEYSGRTQLFLEGLPISRSTMLWTKYLLGLSIVMSAMAFCFIASLAIASRQEIIELRFIQIMTSRWVVFVFCTYSFFFMMGLLGRYRIPLYVGLFVGMVTLDQITDLDFASRGPLALMNDRFAFESENFPTRDLIECSIAGCVFIGVWMMMGMVREGSVATLLAERMSHREKLFVAVAILSMMFVGSTIDEKQTPDPYAIPGAVERKKDGVTLEVEKTEDASKSAELADRMHEDLVAVRDFLAIQSMPPFFVVNRRDLDADRFERASLKNASGVLFRANFASSEWSYDFFRPYMIDVALSNISNYNAIYEPQCWVLEGFSEYWPRSQSFGPEWTERSNIDLRAAYGSTIGFGESDIDTWYQFRERAGEPITRAVACSGLVFAHQKYGDQKLKAFLREVLRTDQPKDVRADVNQMKRPIDKVWQQTMGSSYRQFQSEWIEELGRLQTMVSEPLASMPRLTDDFSLVSKSNVTYEIEVRPRCEPPPDDGNIEIRFAELPVFDAWESEQMTQSQIEVYEPDQSITLSETYSKGERIRLTTSVFVPQLGCDIISGWQRREVE